MAHRKNISGRVILNFTINQDGIVENVVVIKGANIILDKEAVRVIRQIKFSSPAIFNGKAQNLCITMPVGFVFE